MAESKHISDAVLRDESAERVSFLLKKGASPNEIVIMDTPVGQYKKSVLYMAIERHLCTIAILLFKSGANINVGMSFTSFTNTRYESAHELAVRMGYADQIFPNVGAVARMKLPEPSFALKCQQICKARANFIIVEFCANRLPITIAGQTFQFSQFNKQDLAIIRDDLIELFKNDPDAINMAGREAMAFVMPQRMLSD